MKRTTLFPDSHSLYRRRYSRCPISDTYPRASLWRVTYCILALLTLLVPARAQTQINVTYNKDTGGGGTIVTETFLGASCRVQLLLPTVQTGVAGAFFIVRPVNDPVLEFDSFQIRNNTALPWYGLTFSVIPFNSGDPLRTKFGFIDDGTTSTGTGSGGSTFIPTFSGALGNYDGDALLYTGLPIFSELRFTGGGVAVGDTASFKLLNGIPPPDLNSYTVFVTGLAAPEPASALFLCMGAVSLANILRRGSRF